MDKFISRKRTFDDNKASSAQTSIVPKIKSRKYSQEYLNFGFTITEVNGEEKPCVLFARKYWQQTVLNLINLKDISKRFMLTEMDELLCSVVYLTRPQPNYQKLIRVHQNLVEYGPFKTAIAGTGRPRTERTPIFEEGVLYAVDLNSGTGCISQCAVSTERSRTTVHRGTDYSQIIINDVPRLRIEYQHDIFNNLESSKIEVTVAGSIAFLIIAASLQRLT
ncbi:hypothetical protein TNCV_4503611 [Trichonephila clavipes]|nr:hypothetical protein TNCV_4503611 [Trichonephila clavipes]